MDWPLAISKNRERLLAIVVVLVASLGLSRGGRLNTLPHYIYARALAILAPAEAAARRLIVMAAYEMELRGFNLAPRAPASGLPLKGGAETIEVVRRTGEGEFLRRNTPDEAHRRVSFSLIEPLKTFTEETPDYSQFSAANDAARQNRTLVPAAALGLRLLALHHALTHLPTQARRLCNWYRQRDLALKQNRPHRLSPMRPGLPPAWRTRKREPIHEVLDDCHSLANVTRERRGGP